MFEEWQFVIGPEGYRGSAKSVLKDGVCPYNGKKAADYEAEGCKVVSGEELNRLAAEYEQSLIGNWTEITAEQYDDALNILPPLQWTGGGFFCLEAYSGTLHSFYQELDGRYFTSLQSIKAPRADILESLAEWNRRNTK